MRLGVDPSDQVLRSVKPAQRGLAMAIRAVSIGAPSQDRVFLIGRKRREGAWAGKGRPLVDVIVLMHPLTGMVLLVRIGQRTIDLQRCATRGITYGAGRAPPEAARPSGRRAPCHHGGANYHP